MKIERWYTVQDGKVYIHNRPHRNKSQFESVIRESNIQGLKYYVKRFNLKRAYS